MGRKIRRIMPGLTIDELYEAFMDIGAWGTEGEFRAKPFAEDVFDFLDLERKGWDPEDWGEEYGMYLPSFDPAGIKLAGREKEIDYQKAMDTLDITQDVADRVYATELDTLSTELGREMEKGKTVAGGLGLRSGFLESAVEDTLERSATKTKDLGDRLMLSEEEMLNTYNTAMVDATLDFDKTEREEKEAFYDRTMAVITRLGDLGAFERVPTAEGICLPKDQSGYDECAENCRQTKSGRDAVESCTSNCFWNYGGSSADWGVDDNGAPIPIGCP